MIKFISLVLCLFSFLHGFTQEISSKLVFKGQLLSENNKFPLSSLTVFNKRLKQATFTDSIGNFSIYYSIGDTLICSGTSYEKETFIVSSDYANQRVVIELKKKNILLKNMIVYPWPSKEQFKSEFLDLNIVDPVTEALKKHLDTRRLYNKWRAYPILDGPESNYRNFIRGKLQYK